MSPGASPRGGEERSLEVASECDRMEICKIRRQAMISVLAVYEKGVLRPTEPLELIEGETVELTVARSKPPTPPLTADEWDGQVRAAKSIQEWVALANACPNPGPDIDLVKTINESRRLTGFRLPDPVPNGGELE